MTVIKDNFNHIISKPTTIDKKAILVLGMHRSGTSALTRIINLAGASISNNLLPPNQNDNVKGYWESNDILEIHDELLKSIDSNWDDHLCMKPFWLDATFSAEYEYRILDVLEKDFSQNQLFVLKDPRLCRMVPFWISLLDKFGAEPLFVIPVRNPLEVADSLKSRGNYSLSRSLLLWLRHFLEAEFYTREFKRCFTNYESLLFDWPSVLDKISTDLNIEWTGLSSRNIDNINTFLSGNLRHHHATKEELETRPDVVLWVKQAYDWAFQASDMKEAPRDIIDNIRLELETADRLYNPLLAAKEHEFTKIKQDIVRLKNHKNYFTNNFDRIRKILEKKDYNTLTTSEDLQIPTSIDQGNAEILKSENPDNGPGFPNTQNDFEPMIADLCMALQQSQKAQQQVASLTIRINELNQENIELKTRNRVMSSELNTSNREISKRSNELSICIGEIRKLRENLSMAYMKIDQLETDAVNLLNKVKQLRLLISLEIGKTVSAFRDQGGNFAINFFLKKRHAAVLKKAGIVDAEWYLKNNKDVAEQNIDPFYHYMEYGSREGREPNKFLRNIFSELFQKNNR